MRGGGGRDCVFRDVAGSWRAKLAGGVFPSITYSKFIYKHFNDDVMKFKNHY